MVGTTTSVGSRSVSPTPRSRDKDHWKLALERALHSWRMCSQGAYTANPSTVKFNRSSITLFRVANITLHTSILDLQILAGLPKLMGKPVREDHVVKVVIRLTTQWALSEGALKAVSHALKLLSETLFSRATPDHFISRQQLGADGTYGSFQRTDYALDGILHGKWCLYLATLTLWSWGAVTANSASREGSVSMNGISNYGIAGTGVKIEEAEAFNSYPDHDQLAAWNHAHYYLKAMAASLGEKGGLASAPARAETRGLIITMRNLLLTERWELRIAVANGVANR
jgi:hypothetical protein